MRLAIDATGVVAQWVADRIPHVGERGFGHAVALGVVAADEMLMAGVVFHDYDDQARTMQVSCAAKSPRWATRRLIRAILDYPFGQVGVNKCWTVTPHDCARPLRFLKGIGFKQEAVLRHQFGPRKHGVICSLMRGEFARRYHGQEVAIGSPGS